MEKELEIIRYLMEEYLTIKEKDEEFKKGYILAIKDMINYICY